MYSYEERIRAVKRYIKVGKRTGASIRDAGVPDQERAQELASRIRTKPRFVGGICAFEAKVFK